jgi:hypothetical protein
MTEHAHSGLEERDRTGCDGRLQLGNAREWHVGGDKRVRWHDKRQARPAVRRSRERYTPISNQLTLIYLRITGAEMFHGRTLTGRTLAAAAVTLARLTLRERRGIFEALRRLRQVSTLGHSASVVLREHKPDLKTQATYTVNHLRYWLDEKRRKVFV